MRRFAATGWVALAAVSVLVGAAGCGALPSAPRRAPRQATPARGAVVHRTMIIRTGKMLHKPNWPQYSPASWSVRAGDTVVLTIKSYDDGGAPLAGVSPYGEVLGTVGGTERVAGKAVRRIPRSRIAHTFTVPGLGLNLPVPVAPKGGTVTVQATFRVPRAGVYTWQCEAPCGTTASGWGGPMATPGWMQGKITVKA